jgi:hypothetical protein
MEEYASAFEDSLLDLSSFGAMGARYVRDCHFRDQFDPNSHHPSVFSASLGYGDTNLSLPLLS